MKNDSNALLLALAFILMLFFIAHKLESRPRPDNLRFTVFKMMHPNKHKPGKKKNTQYRSHRAAAYLSKYNK